jgi:HAD superfamily hydrolase (TIGR01549 family)
MNEPAPAVLFDIDGTLVDSNYLHVEAWSEGLAALGHPVDDWRIHRAIGMDSAKLLDAILGQDAGRVGDKAKTAHAERYAKLAGRLRPFGGARDLLAAVAGRGLQVVLATSAPQDELRNLLAVLDASAWITHVTSGDDVGTAKPDPDILQVALEKAQVAGDRAVMVGDTVWDGEAARRAGIAFVGVRSGGISAAELNDAGAVAIYDDLAALFADLDGSPLSQLFDRR